ncbi:MAG: DsbA family protein [Rickettsiaceae bacterium H1]|nr:DsbA family protein [Rickettsiaceae bacterium H1]
MKIVVLLIIMVLVASFPFISDWIAKNKNTISYDDDRIYGLVKNYIEDHPDQIMSSLRNYSVKQEEETRQAFIKKVNNAIEKNIEKIYDNSYPTIGSNNKVKVVEFFDYACGHCKQAGSAIETITKDKDVLFTFREIPILGNNSEIVAKAGIAVNLIDRKKYFDFHKKALMHKGPYTEDLIKEIVMEIGIDRVNFEEVWKSKNVNNLLKDSLELFYNLGMGGTPSFIVCNKVIIGANIEGLKQAIDECDTTE